MEETQPAIQMTPLELQEEQRRSDNRALALGAGATITALVALTGGAALVIAGPIAAGLGGALAWERRRWQRLRARAELTLADGAVDLPAQPTR